MSKTFEDRVEEVLGTLQGMAWPILEEADKRRIVSKVVRGLDLGDTVAAWARALGVVETTLRSRVDHFRRSEPLDGPRHAAENQAKRIRSAKSVLRDPVLVQRLVEDPEAARAIAKAAVEHQARTEATEHRSQRERAPELTHRAGFNAVAGDLLRVRSLYARVLDAARDLNLKRDEAAALRGDIDSIAAISDWFISFLDSGASDFESELAQLLEG